MNSRKASLSALLSPPTVDSVCFSWRINFSKQFNRGIIPQSTRCVVPSKMDFSESTKIVYGRIQKLEPEFASKIVGYLLLQDNGDREMIRLAFSPDAVIHAIINKAKIELRLISPKSNQFPTSHWIPQFPPQDHNVEFINSIPQEHPLVHTQMPALCLDDQADFPRHYSRLPELPSKICHYFTKGFCKHGSSCRYLHGFPNEGFSEDHVFSPRSSEKLEFELTELLRSRNGVPVSIALLPMLYYEKYGKNLQAEGYLTESQRHGKAGFSLTKLLAQMRHNIRIIERAHGQHAVILAEDLPKYLDYAIDHTEHGSVSIGARQIYLTFPAESVFAEQDVYNYFSGFGPVQDVRIPCQQRRMFGFVTFLFPETVRKILAKGNPHFICGARVLVKPYREKSRLADRKNAERKHPSSHFGFDGESNVPPLSRTFSDMRFGRKQIVAEQEHELELERRRLSEFQLEPKPHDLKLNADHFEEVDSPAAERFSFLFDILKDGPTNEERARFEQDSNQGLNLPDSPFASAMANGISTAT